MKSPDLASLADLAVAPRRRKASAAGGGQGRETPAVFGPALGQAFGQVFGDMVGQNAGPPGESKVNGPSKAADRTCAFPDLTMAKKSEAAGDAELAPALEDPDLAPEENAAFGSLVDSMAALTKLDVMARAAEAPSAPAPNRAEAGAITRSPVRAQLAAETLPLPRALPQRREVSGSAESLPPGLARAAMAIEAAGGHAYGLQRLLESAELGTIGSPTKSTSDLAEADEPPAPAPLGAAKQARPFISLKPFTIEAQPHNDNDAQHRPQQGAARAETALADSLPAKREAADQPVAEATPAEQPKLPSAPPLVSVAPMRAPPHPDGGLASPAPTAPPAQQIIQHISGIQTLLREHLPSQTLRIRLMPEGLGAVDVSITRRADTVLVTLKAEVQETLTSLQADSDVLETALFAAEGLRPVVQCETLQKSDASPQDNGSRAFLQRGDTGLGGNSPQPQPQSRRASPELRENAGVATTSPAAADISSHPQPLRAGTALYL